MVFLLSPSPIEESDDDEDWTDFIDDSGVLDDDSVSMFAGNVFIIML